MASIAAAENHSLCSTSDGAVFAWGSNGFGQLGIHSSRGGDVVEKQGSHDGTNNVGGVGGGGGSRLSPRRVEGDLKHSFVVSVACGERHSVALTRLGEVYCWGDNKKGQLGVINVSEMQVSGVHLFATVAHSFGDRNSKPSFLVLFIIYQSLMGHDASRVFGRHNHVEGRLQYLLQPTPLSY